MIRKKKKFFNALILFLTLIGITFYFVECGKEESPIAPVSYDTTKLNAIPVSTAPTLDGKDTDAVWASAPELTLKNQATMKAVYTADKIYILAKWDDTTLSMVRGGSWQWDSSANSWKKSSNVEEGAFNEDRFSIMWNINISAFPVNGCMTKCHGAQGDATGAYLEIVGEYADMWHMKAARTFGAIDVSESVTPTINDTFEAIAGTVNLTGFYDDKVVAAKDDPDYPFSSEDGGRHGDAKTVPIERHNRNSAKDAPLYMESNPTNWIDAMTLTEDEITNGETIIADPTNANYAGNGAVTTAWTKYSSLKAIVPERIMNPNAAGSRADVKISAIWSDGVWTVEIERKLNTGNNDDVQFDDLNKDYYFATTIMDNSGGERHNLSDKLEVLHFIK